MLGSSLGFSMDNSTIHIDGLKLCSSLLTSWAQLLEHLKCMDIVMRESSLFMTIKTIGREQLMFKPLLKMFSNHLTIV